MVEAAEVRRHSSRGNCMAESAEIRIEYGASDFDDRQERSARVTSL